MIAVRFARFSAVCALLLGAGLAGAAPASATGTAGSCAEGAGVTVVVDFGDLGPQPLIRCAAGTPANGIATLQAAGVDVAGSQKYGLAVACRIDGKPGPDVESCAGMPSATAYWSYWHASAGGAWESSQEGAQTSKPVANGFEGWAFARPKSANDLPTPPRVAPVRQAATAAPDVAKAGDTEFPWGFVIGAVVVLLLAGAGVFIASRRRRRREQ
ncbi:LPXTG cell wall anchor domain-containing protein [Amycolatopsis sp. NPDC051061]|uniref:LPXTG cell wall anchor domain-containing protein n=1 Tax=Amycolatopsis sp. NPDC051061 TaxID=3155042 RepID=UPI003431E8BB